MKLNTLKYILGIACLTLVFSCEESDKIIDQVTEDTTRGAVLRQMEVLSNTIEYNSVEESLVDGQQFGVVLEFQDATDGSTLNVMNVYVGYNGAETTVPEALYEAVPASSFAPGDRSLPTITYTVTGAQMQSFTGVTDSQLAGSDIFTVRFEAVLNDGRAFSVANNSGNMTGSYYSSFFAYDVPIVCGPAMPAAGTWTVNAMDSYGDGWNGASISYVLDGTEAGSVTLDEGAEGALEFEVPDGTGSIGLVYNMGDWDGEVTFTVISANGNQVASAGGIPGDILLDFCAF